MYYLHPSCSGSSPAVSGVPVISLWPGPLIHCYLGILLFVGFSPDSLELAGPYAREGLSSRSQEEAAVDSGSRVSEYGKLVFREEFGERGGGQAPNHLGFSVSVGADYSENQL